MIPQVLHVICPEPAGARGGADLHVRDLALKLRDRGFPVQVLVLGDSAFADEIRIAGCPAFSVSIASGPRVILDYLRLRTPSRPRIVHGHGYEADLVACAAVLFSRNGHFVATAHGFLRINRRMRIMTRLNLLALRKADSVLAVSTPLTNELSLKFPSVKHIPNGTAAPARRRRSKLGRPPRLGFVGRFSLEKRPDMVVDTSRRLHELGVGHETLMFGDGPQRHQVALRVDEDRMPDIRLMGFESDIDALYDELDVLVVCSESEGSPQVVLEAMSRGVAVVANDVGDLREMLDGGRCGVIVDPTSPSELVEGCRHLLTNENAREALALAARQRWESHYQLGGMVDEIQRVYERVVG